jgi:hypothetical protein
MLIDDRCDWPVNVIDPDWPNGMDVVTSTPTISRFVTVFVPWTTSSLISSTSID